MPEFFQRLPERAAIEVAGPDSASFLQGLVTADAAALAPGDATYSALLIPQGKILFDFFLLRRQSGFFVDCAASQRNALLKRLGFYKLRAKVDIAPRDDLSIVVSDEPLAGGYVDPRFMGLGWRAFLASDTAGAEGGYHTRRIALGIGDSDADIGSGELFPHEANLDQLGGVSFTKGCYVGQEVVSRMEHRRTARTRILPIALSGPPPQKDAPVTAGAKQVGTLLSSSGQRALALLRLDRLADATAQGAPLLTEDVRVHVIKPQWARFDVPSAETVT